MSYQDRLPEIFERTNGACHLCHGPLCFSNYNQPGRRGAWHVEHSRARALGGTDRLSNLYPAHIDCNLYKGTRSTRSVRREFGRTAAPLSTTKRERVRKRNAVSGGAMGATIGGLFGGPPGAVVGGLLGALFGYEEEPDKQRRGR